MPKGDLPNCFDPYLRYAISTDFKNFEFFDERKKLFFLVEFKQTDPASPSGSDDPASQFAKAMRQAGVSLEFGPADDNTRYATMRANTAAIALYRIARFEPVGRRAEYYSDPPETAIVMRFFS